MTGWWFQPTPLKNDGVKVSWDDESISQYLYYIIHMGKKCSQPPTRIGGF